jgi:RNA polymerase sigma factor (sigma-70 family)
MQTYPYEFCHTSYQHFLQFKQGDEAGLTRLYRDLNGPLLRHGLRIVRDKFVVSTAIQEAFLKAWDFRARLTDVLHTFRFLRLNVTWKCYNYYRQPDRQNNRMIYTDDVDKYTVAFDVFEEEEDNQAFSITEEKLKTIYDVMPYLPADRKTILTLYFKYGYSYKQIARRFASSSQAISHELQEGLEHLKKIIHSKKRLDNTSNDIKVLSDSDNIKERNYPECLQGELLQLFRLRYENKWSFEIIAAQMNLPLAYVQQQYIAAHLKLKQMTKKG